jgi:hypothetical protein
MEQTYILNRLKEMTIPEFLDAIAEAYSGKAVDIYDHLPPATIDKITDSLFEFIEEVKKINPPG